MDLDTFHEARAINRTHALVISIRDAEMTTGRLLQSYVTRGCKLLLTKP